MFRTVRCTTALLTLLSAAACADLPTAPSAREEPPESVAPVPQARTSADCDPETGVGCCYESQPWWC